MLKALDLHYALQRNAMFCSYIKITTRVPFGLYYKPRVNTVMEHYAGGPRLSALIERVEIRPYAQKF